MDGWYSTEGSSSHLGVTWIEEEQAFNFALYSKHAAEVTLLLYSRSDLVHPLHEYRFNPFDKQIRASLALPAEGCRDS